MNSSLRKHIVRASVLVLLSSISAINTHADNHPETMEVAKDSKMTAKIVKERHKGFKSMGRAMKSLNRKIKSGASDMPEITAAAEIIVNTAPLIADWFPIGTGPDSGLKTDALAYIWKNPEKFSAAGQDLINESKVLLDLAKSSADKGALMKQLLVVKDNCSACHKSFRAD